MWLSLTMNGILCAYCATTAPSTPSVEATALQPPSIASFDDVLGIEVHRVRREARAGRVLDALIDRQDRHVAACPPGARDLNSACRLRSTCGVAVGVEPDAVDEVRARAGAGATRRASCTGDSAAWRRRRRGAPRGATSSSRWWPSGFRQVAIVQHHRRRSDARSLRVPCPGPWVRCAHMEHNFTGPSYTIGIEEELMIVDAETLDLVNAIESLPRRQAARGRDQARAHGVGARDRDRPVREHRRGGRAAARAAPPGPRRRPSKQGLTIGSAGTHPFAMWEDQRIVARPRYRDLISALRFVARQEMIFGMHVHVGIDDPEKAIHVANGMRVHLPVLLALSGELAVLARRRDRARLDPHADLPRVPARRHSARLRRLGRLRARDRVHGRTRA